MAKKSKVKNLVFVCPECGSNKLGQTQNVLTCYPVISIPNNGNLEYNSKEAVAIDSTILGHQCWNCSYELYDENWNPITDTIDIPAWIKKNCPQPKVKK
jgi:hypothetical protein